MLKIILIIAIIMIYLGIGTGVSFFVNCDLPDEFNEAEDGFVLIILFWPIMSVGLIVYAIIKVVFERDKK